MDNYIDLKPFKFWCQKMLPLVYDDSLSYYELLCKVVDYLNKTMENVETLHTAYEKLESYVNNYFSSLDVQEEINNKLDEMANSGELYEIIRRYTDPIINEQNEKIKKNSGYILNLSAIGFSETNTSEENTNIFIDALRNYNSAIIFIPRGEYNLNTLNINFDIKSLKIVGCGSNETNGTRLKIESGYLFNISSALTNVTFEDFTIRCKIGSSGFNFNGTKRSMGINFNRISIHNATYGITANEVVYMRMNNSSISLGNDSIGYCVKIKGYEYNYFENCSFQNNIDNNRGKDLVIIDSTEYTWFTNCEFAKCSTSCIKILSETNNARRIWITDCVFYAAMYGVHIINKGNYSNGDTTIQNCKFYSAYDGSIAVYGEKYEGSTNTTYDLIVTDCICTKMTSYAGVSRMFYFDNGFLRDYKCSFTSNSYSSSIFGNNIPNELSFNDSGLGQTTLTLDGVNKFVNLIIGNENVFPILKSRVPKIIVNIDDTTNNYAYNAFTVGGCYYDNQNRLRTAIWWETAPPAGTVTAHWRILY